MLSYSTRLPTSLGSVVLGPLGYCTGPYCAIPANPVVLVATPSMLFDRKLTSSTYTPGAKYSDIGSFPFRALGRKKRVNGEGARQSSPKKKSMWGPVVAV